MTHYIETSYDKSSLLAEYYLMNALETNHPVAGELLEHIHDKTEDLGEIYELVFNWHMEIRSSPRVLYNIGYMYENGIGTKKNRRWAIDFYSRG
jgi:TPR repeat protein